LDIYLKRKRGKILLLIVAVIIGLASLLYTNWLTEKMAIEDRKKVELWAEATKRMADTGIQSSNQTHIEQLNTAYLSLIQSILEQNTTIPVVIVEPGGQFNYDANISFNEDRRQQVLSKELQNTRRDLTLREDRLREAEKELEDRNARLIELQEVLAQKEQAVKDLRDKVMRALVGFTDDGLTVHEKNGKVYVSMDEKLLFKTGRWDVDPNGQRALRDLSKLLAENPDINIMVEGHTDDVPMRGSGEVKDNWDLSVMRATAVTKILTQNPELDPERIIAAGRSEYVPLVSGTTPEARQMNRRTEIILTPKLDELLEILESN